MDFGQIEIEFWTTESPLGSHREAFLCADADFRSIGTLPLFRPQSCP